MPANGRDILQRRQQLANQRAPREQHWEEMAAYISPSRCGIVGPSYNNQPSIMNKQYDSTTMMAAELMAHFVAGHVINPGQYWLGYEIPELLNDDETNEWLEECRDISLKQYAASLFYAEGPECLIDWGGFGTGLLMNEEIPQPVNRHIRGFRGFRFYSVRTGRFLISEGTDGMVDTLFIDYVMSARNIRDNWADKSPYMPEIVKSALEKGELDRPFDVIHAIYPRPKGEQGYGSKGMPWTSCWTEKESKEIIYESGYRTFPAACPRYHRTPGHDPYGRGRGDIAFPDSWTLNTAKRMGFEDWALKIRPPILHAHDSVYGTLSFKPGYPVSVNTHGRPINHVLAPFQTGSAPEVSQIKEEELRKSIRQTFYIDQILALLEVSKSEMTAFEFARKIELVFRLIGPVYGRLEWEWLYREVDITWDILQQARAFPPPPPQVFDTSGTVNVKFNNPIAKAMRSGDAEALMFALNDIAPLVERFPQMLDWIEPDETVQGILTTRGVPAKWRRSNVEVTSLREARAEQEQQELMMQNVNAMAGAAGKAAPMLKAISESTTQNV